MEIKRRDLLTAGVSAVVAAAVPLGAHAALPPGAEDFPVGEFILRRIANGLQVLHQRGADRVLWETAGQMSFVVLETATADIKDFGKPQGNFRITDSVSVSYDNATIEAVAAAGSGVVVTGKVTGSAGEAVGFKLSFEAIVPTQLRFTLAADGANASTINRVLLNLASSPDEGVFGFGQQLTYFNQKGHALPILVQEHGVGRGQPIVTEVIDLMADGGGNTPYATEAPAPHFITSSRRSMFLENTEYSTFDMRDARAIQIKLWSPVMTGRIVFGETPLDLIESYTEFSGRMRVLPDWVHQGLIIGTQGGTARVRGIVAQAQGAGIPIAGVWLQDWSGVRVTDVGTQLWWNWTLDETYYPGWQQLVADLESQGARILTYINPFLSTEPGHDSLYQEGLAKGYLVLNPDGTAFLNRNTNFSAALVDFSNPAARAWIKNVIKTEMIEKARSSGWMNDFGEALPFNGKLHDGADPDVWHNLYPVEWQRVAREAIEEAGRGDDITFFSRSGFTQSPEAATLFWLGDQIQNWNQFDGIKTAVCGLLAGGMSGFSLNHSDTGGYSAFSVKVGGKKVPVIARTPELLARWTELNAFTAVLRGHEGLDPEIAAQFNTNADTLAHTARFAKVYKGLASYRKRVIAEASEKGYPLCRHLFLHYPDDPNTHDIRYQFLLGRDVLVAPVLDKGRETVDVYFPAGDDEWTDLWTGSPVGKAETWVELPAPIGTPAVFLRKGGENNDEIIAGLKAVGILS